MFISCSIDMLPQATTAPSLLWC